MSQPSEYEQAADLSDEDTFHFAKVAGTHEGWADGGSRAVVAELRRLGWKIEPPRPRFSVTRKPFGWVVAASGEVGRDVATFYDGHGQHPEAEAAARAEAERLNDLVVADGPTVNSGARERR